MFFRNRRIVRAVACYLLVQTSSSLFFPAISVAMSGPSQPEFTSYEAPGSTDMVNLSTGDLTYSIPALDIPGPERSFSLPLSYKAGITLEQEASWVGLGWSLNPGAITRSVNGYADDADNEQVETTFNKQVDRGWTGAFPRIMDFGWSANSGFGGTVGMLGIKNGQVNSVHVLGVTFEDGRVTKVDDPFKTLAMSFIAGPPSAASIAVSVIQALAAGRQGGVVGFNNQPSRDVEQHLWGDNYWIYYNNNTTESGYGSLNFRKMSERFMSDPYPQNSPSTSPNIYPNSQATSYNSKRLFSFSRELRQTGNHIYETGADVYQDGRIRLTDYYGGPNPTIDSKKYKSTSNRPISIAHDYFSVMGEGVSGSIQPYRLDIGSIAYPKLGVNIRPSNDPNSYLNSTIPHYKYMVVPFRELYKPAFRYEGSLSNGYTYHRYNPASGKSPTGFDINTNDGSLTINDPKLNDYNSRIEGQRKGLTDTYDSDNYQSDVRIEQGKRVTWYSNKEIVRMYPDYPQGANKGFLEFTGPAVAANSATMLAYRRSLPPNGIGAFSIIAEDGTTYHYSLPVYHYQTYSEANEVRNASTTGTGLGKSTRRVGQPGSDWTGSQYAGAYATAWLLTAITSADYIDQNNSGTVDAADLGGWVRFDYGKFSSRFKWRQPYIGNSYADDTTVINNAGFTQGCKETYYLNSIATRSHTALFVKSVRQDNRGHFDPNTPASVSKLDIDERSPASSLRLDEIILLDNQTLTKLQTVDGIRQEGDNTSTPALTNATSSIGSAFVDNPMVGSGDNINQVLDTHDLSVDSRIRMFINANAIKRIHFNYDYDLCRGVPNSFVSVSNDLSTLPMMDESNISTNRSGKLTLKSVSFFGPTTNSGPTKIIPDYVFGYDNPDRDATITNPAYGKDLWDAFGMYSPEGKYSVTSHKPQRYYYATPWTLTKITSPLGGETIIKYERDEYAHVSEFGTTKIHVTQDDNSSTLNITNKNGLGGSLSSVLKVNDRIILAGYQAGTAMPFSDPKRRYRAARRHYATPAIVTAVSETQVTIKDELLSNLVYEHGEFDFVVANNVVGGDIRVSSITTKEGDASYQVRYKYNQNSSGDSWYNSSGVIAKEPTFLDRFEHSMYGLADYPSTSVLYGKVTVLRGSFHNGDDDYDKREVYSFFTPETSMVTEDSPNWKTVFYGDGPYGALGAIPVMTVANQTIIDIGKIGQLKKVEMYNRRGEQELSTSFTYSSNVPNIDNLNSQGHYTEAILNNERVNGEYMINRSTKEYLPTVMLSSQNTRNGITSKATNNLYDFYTGRATETTLTNSLGKIVHSLEVPAYTLPGNSGMGTKGDNALNKHMLVQQGASYAYTDVPGGPAYNPRNPLNPATSRILSASVQTWQNNWTNYREIDADGNYQDVAGQQPVWRKSATYLWQSPVLDVDGSFKDFTPFNWSGPSDRRWVKAGENVRYDHYSHILEARDVNGRYVTQKTGYNQSQLIASASGARYTEIAYSGAEDQFQAGGAAQFGGEITAGGTPVIATASAPAHTGLYSLRLTSGTKGFLYRAQVGRDIDANKLYRASVWVRSGATSGKLYAALDGNRIATTTISSPSTKKAGDWYLLTLLYKVSASAKGQMLEVGCANDGNPTAYFDDFRVAPLTATITSNVYDPRTNNLLYVLDNNNLYTQYEYTPTGRLKTVYQEALDGTGSAKTRIKEYEYNYSRLYFPTWVTTVYQCEIDEYNNYTGRERRKVEDVNPLNTNPTPAKWETSGNSVSCMPQVCPPDNDPAPSRVRNNICERATPNYNHIDGPQKYESCGAGGHRYIYHWVWADGTTPPDTSGDCQTGTIEDEKVK